MRLVCLLPLTLPCADVAVVVLREPPGPFVIMIYEMLLNDVLCFLSLLSVFLMAFTQVPLRSARPSY
jgi:hypothetical protein